MRGWLAFPLMLTSMALATLHAVAEEPESVVFDIPNNPSAPLVAGRLYEIVVRNVAPSEEREAGAVFDLVPEGGSPPLASVGALADAERDGMLKLIFQDVTFPGRGGYAIVGPGGFRLEFSVEEAPGGSAGASSGSGAPRLVVDGAAGRILEPGRVPEGTRVDLVVTNLPTGDGSIREGAVFALRAPGESEPRDRRAAVLDAGALTVTFPDVTLAAGAWRVEGPSGFAYALRINPNGAGEDPTDAVTIRHPVGTEAPPAPVGTRADLTIVMIGITGARDVLSTFELVAPSGRVMATTSAYLIEPQGQEHLAVTFASVTLDEAGPWTVRGPEDFAYSFEIAERGLPALAAPWALAAAAGVALLLGRR